MKIEKRQILYFNKYRYKASLCVIGAGYSYYTNDVESFIERIEKFKNSSNSYWNKGWHDTHYLDKIDYDQISKFITWRTTIGKDQCLYRIQGDKVSFFSNNIDLLRTLESIDHNVEYTEALCHANSEMMYFKKKPNHKFRTYFRGKRMPKDFSDNVRTVSETYKSLHFSPALLRILFDHTQYNPYRYLHGSYYVEYDDEQMLTILSIWFPNMLHKTYSLHKEQ